MDWPSIWSSIVANLFYGALIVLGSIVIGFLRARYESLAGPVLYGMAGGACIAIILFAVMGRAVFSRPQQQVTPENIEGNIRQWADIFGLAIQKQASVPETYFAYQITLSNGTPVLVSRSRDRGRYLSVVTRLAVSSEHAAILARLSKDKNVRIIDELALEAARSKVGYQIVGPPLTGIILGKSIPITSNLTEASFAESLDVLDSANSACREAIRLAIDRAE